ncbi:MAG: EFR1 family ferrodoxin [Sarcina sp.]
MVVLYFSGTGNTRYIAKNFANKMECKSYSIEIDVDFEQLISRSDTVAFCYPIYGSCVPRIMEEFVQKYKQFLNNKKIVILITQMMFSGDGARVFTDLLGGIKYEVIYAEHFNMPLNIPNIPVINVKNGDKLKKKIGKADKKLDKVCEDINNKVVRKRGFNKFSKIVGAKLQRDGFEKMEHKIKNAVKVNDECILCSKCVKVCPKKNLFIENGKIQHRGDCTVCDRCMNVCPKKAITILYHGKVREQYKGIK